MSIPYIPLYVADFEADTAHLTLEEDGAYNRLLRLCWRTPGCSIPADPKWIMRKMRIGADDYYRVVEPLIEEFFTRGMDRIFQPRLQREHDAIEDAHKKRSDAGKRGNEVRWGLKTNKKSNRKAKILRSQPELEPEPVKREDKSSPKRGSRLPPDWELPKECEVFALGEGMPPERVELEAAKFRDYWVAKAGKDGAKLDWPATWRNWIRNAKKGPRNEQPSVTSITEAGARIAKLL